MSISEKGKWVSVSPGRKIVLDFMNQAQQIPSLPLAREFDLEPLAALRQKTGISWTVLFMKAYGILSRQNPELRRSYLRWPWAHYYEHPQSTAGILVERFVNGEKMLLGGKIQNPETHSLQALESRVRFFAEAPVHEVRYFRQILRFSRIPGLIRRLLLWKLFQFSGKQKAKRLGTFLISSLGKYGVDQVHPLTFLTSYFTFGPISPSGKVTCKIIYDHRVMDGAGVARCLVELEKILKKNIGTELEDLAQSPWLSNPESTSEPTMVKSYETVLE